MNKLVLDQYFVRHREAFLDGLCYAGLLKLSYGSYAAWFVDYQIERRTNWMAKRKVRRSNVYHAGYLAGLLKIKRDRR